MNSRKCVFALTAVWAALLCGACATGSNQDGRQIESKQTSVGGAAAPSTQSTSCADFPAAFVGTYAGSWGSTGACGSGTLHAVVDKCGNVTAYSLGPDGRASGRQTVSITGRTCGGKSNGSTNCGQIDGKTGIWQGTWQNGACSGSFVNYKQPETSTSAEAEK